VRCCYIFCYLIYIVCVPSVYTHIRALLLHILVSPIYCDHSWYIYLYVCASDTYVVIYCICGHCYIFCYLICIVRVAGVYTHIRSLFLHTLGISYIMCPQLIYVFICVCFWYICGYLLYMWWLCVWVQRSIFICACCS
jgi:hypothetical protein